MGQAKARGTREKRIAQAQERDAVRRAEYERREAEAKALEAQRVSMLTPQEQKRYSERRHRGYMRTANMVGLLLAMQERGRNA